LFPLAGLLFRWHFTLAKLVLKMKTVPKAFSSLAVLETCNLLAKFVNGYQPALKLVVLQPLVSAGSDSLHFTSGAFLPSFRLSSENLAVFSQLPWY
jgi:hypothetical protein